ncbi:MAG: CAP domain-containing protein [Candidatus Obscuribacterales bacterium]
MSGKYIVAAFFLLCALAPVPRAFGQGACSVVYLDKKQVPMAELGCYGVPVTVKTGPVKLPGICLTGVRSGTRAAANKLQTGDVVMKINGLAVPTPKALNDIMINLKNSIVNIDYGRLKNGKFQMHRQEFLQVASHANAYASRPVTDLENFMYTLVDADRKKKGLKGLKLSSGLAKMARSHADDMAKRNYTGHVTPEGRGTVERYKMSGLKMEGGITENCAYPFAQPNPLDMVRSGEEQLMRSEDHRANIMHPDIVAAGIGIAYRRDGGLMIVQVFSSAPIP